MSKAKATASVNAVNTLTAAVAALEPHVSVQPTEGTGNGGQTRFNVAIHGVSISSLTRALASTTGPNLPRLTIMAVYAAMKLPVSPATVKAQHGSGKGRKAGESGPHGTTPDWSAMPEALRNGIKAVVMAIINDAVDVPALAKTLNTGVTAKASPASFNARGTW